LYVKADANKDTFLNLEEFINFSNLMGDSLKAKYGGSYTLTKEQSEKRFKAYDLNGNG
jgi:viroplasmin and RNaseH domain-containing protein